MKHGIYGILAVLLALLLAFQLPMTSFAAAEEAAPEEEAEEDETELDDELRIMYGTVLDEKKVLEEAV